MRIFFAIAICVIAISNSAIAESEFSFYSGTQGSPHSGVRGTDSSAGGIGDFDFTAGWEGRPMEMPPYYGFRYTRWTSETFGWGFDFNHTKAYADDETLADSGFSTLEFSDGLNHLTINAYRRFPDLGWPVTPYVGAGLGLSIPHVEVDTGGEKTFEYQIAGPAAQVVAGASYRFSDRWSVFGEYKGSYSINSMDLEGGGELETNIVTNAFNIGISLGF